MSEMKQASKTRVLVLFGGRSGEHGISCATAASVLEAIDRDRFEPVPVGIAPDGTWVRVPDDPDLYRLSDGGAGQIASVPERVGLLPALSKLVEINGETTSITDLGQIDVVFPLLHGPYGEDGTIQGLAEFVGIPYVGCGVLASAAAMDKHVTKALLSAQGIPAGRWSLVTDRMWRMSRDEVLDKPGALGLPVFVKPCRAGSSLGITRVTEATDLAGAIEEARRFDPRVIVEAQLRGLEVECAVLGGREGAAPRVSVPGLIDVADSVEFYDFETKYIDHDAVKLTIPAPLGEALTARVRSLAQVTFDALECEGLARVDFFVDTDSGEVVVNEVNTMPGFTPYSMYPALWAHEGLDYTSLVSELIDLALTRPIGLR